MSLLDALLLDPVRIDIWLSAQPRNDGSSGTGTANDPYDCSTDVKFDTLMSDPAKIGPNTCIHLGPGTFKTKGYAEGTVTWQPQKGMMIVGSGIDVTTLQLVKNGSVTGKQFYVVGHDLTSGSVAKTVDFFDMSSLTIDCNLTAGTNTSCAAGAIRLMGNHSRISRVKVINWGAKTSAPSPAYVVSMLTANTNAGTANVSGVLNCGIEGCIVVNPDSATPTSFPVVVLHVGNKELPGATQGAGLGPYIRNCYVDGTVPPSTVDLNREIRALSMSWCKAGIVEGNVVQNVRYGGPFQDTQGAYEITVRNNTYRNVCTGPFWSLNKTGPEFITKLLVEGNSVELPVSGFTGITPIGVSIGDEGTGGAGTYGDVMVRNNKIRYLDSDVPVGQTGTGVYAAGVTNLLVRENIAYLAPTTPLRNERCTAVSYFDNRKPNSSLIRGYNITTGTSYSELITDAEDGYLLGFLKRR